jgi:CcmD family protein
MLANGKIFVVVAVLALILVGIFIYLFTIDRKVNKLEKEVEEKKSDPEE